jgi:LuxR family maltose regulon positive regulatory protein
VEIAGEPHLVEGTIRNQLSRIFDKMNISGNSDNKRLELESFFNKRFRE